MSTNFAAVADGVTQDQVIQLMGTPHNVGGCYDGALAAYHLDGCAESYIHASAWVPLNPEYPVVWFDRQKRVIGKYDFASP